MLEDPLFLDETMMRRALNLAKRGRAWVAPNPMVGAVVVRDGKIVGEGYHRRFGGHHAEVFAIRAAGEKAKGATLYVSLEPCCHFGKTPPCTDLILSSGIKRVVAARTDPNPQVNGRGFQILRDAGVDVTVGVLEKEATELNRPYLKKAATGKCWVTLKIAQTIDGRIASITGHSQWISGKEALRYAHLLRAMHDGVLVGAGTVIVDDPTLNVRHVPGRNPVRVVIDSHFRIPGDCKLLNTPDVAPTWVFGVQSENSLPEWKDRENVRIFQVGRDEQGRVDLGEVMEIVGREGVGSMMVEGGSGIWTSFLHHQLVDKLEFIIAPMIIGHGIDAIGNLGITTLDDAIQLAPFRWRRIGKDLHVAARVLHEEESF